MCLVVGQSLKWNIISNILYLNAISQCEGRYRHNRVTSNALCGNVWIEWQESIDNQGEQVIWQVVWSDWRQQFDLFDCDFSPIAFKESSGVTISSGSSVGWIAKWSGFGFLSDSKYRCVPGLRFPSLPLSLPLSVFLLTDSSTLRLYIGPQQRNEAKWMQQKRPLTGTVFLISAAFRSCFSKERDRELKGKNMSYRYIHIFVAVVDVGGGKERGRGGRRGGGRGGGENWNGN